MKTRKQIIEESVTMTRDAAPTLGWSETHRAVAITAASIALSLAGFSDAIPQSSPRPVELPPRMPGKKGEYGPTETRKAEE